MESPGYLVVFVLNDQRYGLPLASVERIIRSVEVTPAPHLPEVVHGIINIRNVVTPVVNLRKRLGLPGKRVTLTDQFIILKTSGKLFAVVVDLVEGVIPWKQEQVVESQRKHPDSDCMATVVVQNGEMILVLDPKKMIPVVEEADLEMKRLERKLGKKKPTPREKAVQGAT